MDVKFKSAYSAPVRVSVDCSGSSLAKQCFKDECDINRIVKKWQNGDVVSHVNRFSGDYGDFTATDDYQSSLNMVMAAQNSFMALPSNIRRRFENDPGQFLTFVQNPENFDEMVSLGLAVPKPDDRFVKNVSTGDIAPQIAGEPVETKPAI